MRKLNSKIILLFIFIASITVAQENYGIDSIKIYAIKWNGKYPYAKNLEGIKKLPKYYFATTGTQLNTFFNDYEDCVNKLGNEKNITISENLLNALVILVFYDKKEIELGFDTKGNYLFKGKWHKINYEFYYTLFKYFSNEVMPEKILKTSKNEYKDNLWND